MYFSKKIGCKFIYLLKKMGCKVIYGGGGGGGLINSC